ncbi:MAG: alpha/beta fold hydrolase [Balneolaceae bacterium]|nr:alpha/beta fold hydrolase [Balneolaceae bacterium]
MRIVKVRFCYVFMLILLITLCVIQNGAAEQIEKSSISEGIIQSKDGVELYYQVQGTGLDTLMMLHGGPGLNIDYMAPDLERLEESFTLIYYDQRGSGRSALVSEPELLTVDDHVADIEAVRKYFGLEKLSLFGHSWGALLASYYALEYPGNLSKMVFASPGPPRLTPYMQLLRPNIMAWMDSSFITKVEQLIEARQDTSINAITSCEAFWEIFIRGYFADPHDMETIRSMKGSFCSGSESALRNGGIVSLYTWESMGEFDLRDKLHDIHIPVLIISGTEDIFPEESMCEWKAAYPDSHLVLLERAGHYPQVERPDEFFKSVKEFLWD